MAPHQPFHKADRRKVRTRVWENCRRAGVTVYAHRPGLHTYTIPGVLKRTRPFSPHNSMAVSKIAGGYLFRVETYERTCSSSRIDRHDSLTEFHSLSSPVACTRTGVGAGAGACGCAGGKCQGSSKGISTSILRGRSVIGNEWTFEHPDCVFLSGKLVTHFGVFICLQVQAKMFL